MFDMKEKSREDVYQEKTIGKGMIYNWPVPNLYRYRLAGQEQQLYFQLKIC